MARRQRTLWSAAFDAMSANIEAQQVIGLRLAKIAMGGPAASVEAHRMMDEKVATAWQVQGAAMASLMTGGAASIPGRTAATYRRKVRANRRRLMKERL